MCNVVDLQAWQDQRDQAFWDREARKQGYSCWAALESDVVDMQLEEMQNDPGWKEYVRECRIYRRLERARKRK